jgi:hypothetical protein
MNEKIIFQSEGEKLKGNLFKNDNSNNEKPKPAIIVVGSWTTVKEQMAGLYAEKLAIEGFITLAFDFRGYGESEGRPRFYESPTKKIEDINNAIIYLKSRSDISSMGLLGICAGAGYVLESAIENENVDALVTVASWLHDNEAVKLFYGGEEGVNQKISQARAAKKKYEETGEIDYIPTISTTDESAAMFGEYDYYLNKDRGAIPEWSSDKFAVMSWEDWLGFDPMQNASRQTKPILMVHSDGCVLPDNTRKYFESIQSREKKIEWVETTLQSPFHQFSFYDQQDEVAFAVQKAKRWFLKFLS